MKKTSPKVQKLTLSRETVYRLTHRDLQQVNGGAILEGTGWSVCGEATCLDCATR